MGDELHAGEYDYVLAELPYLIDSGDGYKCPLCRDPIEPRDVYCDSSILGHKACVIERRAKEWPVARGVALGWKDSEPVLVVDEE